MLWLPSLETDKAARVQILCPYPWESDESNYSLFSYVYIEGQTGFFNLVIAIGITEEKPEFKPVKLCLKNRLLSHLARLEGSVDE